MNNTHRVLVENVPWIMIWLMIIMTKGSVKLVKNSLDSCAQTRFFMPKMSFPLNLKLGIQNGEPDKVRYNKVYRNFQSTPTIGEPIILLIMLLCILRIRSKIDRRGRVLTRNRHRKIPIIGNNHAVDHVGKLTRVKHGIDDQSYNLNSNPTYL